MGKEHQYQISVEWTGNLGQGTADYRSYERAHLIKALGKPDLLGSSDPQYKGDASRWNPEELLLASLSACHMLWYLHLCSSHKIIVTAYEDSPAALLAVDSSGKGFIKEAILNPKIHLTDLARRQEAENLHEEAHQKCFIANSINFGVRVNPSFVS